MFVYHGLFTESSAHVAQTITITTNDCYCYGLGHMGSNPGKQTMVNKRELTSLITTTILSRSFL